MNDLTSFKWGLIISASGIAFGWLLNQLSQWVRSRKEDKRNLKKVIFNLYEIHYVLQRSDMNRIIEIVINKIYLRLPKQVDNDESKEFIKNIYKKFYENDIKKYLLNNIEEMHGEYHQSIALLAEINPRIAFYLKDKTKILYLINLVQNGVETLIQEFSEENSDPEQEQNYDYIKSELINESLKELRSIIKKLSFMVSPIEWMKSMRFIKLQERLLKENANSKFNDLFDNIANQKH